MNKYLEKIAISIDTIYQQGLDLSDQGSARFYGKGTSQAAYDAIYGSDNLKQLSPDIRKSGKNLVVEVPETVKDSVGRTAHMSVGVEGRAGLGKYPSPREFDKLIDSLPGTKAHGFHPDMSAAPGLKKQYRDFILKRRLLQAAAAAGLIGGTMWAGNKYLEKMAKTGTIKPVVKPIDTTPDKADLRYAHSGRDVLAQRNKLEDALEQLPRPQSLREVATDRARSSARSSDAGNAAANAVKKMQEQASLPRSSALMTKQRLR